MKHVAMGVGALFVSLIFTAAGCGATDASVIIVSEGCRTDLECKGDRICHEGSCVFPEDVDRVPDLGRRGLACQWTFSY